MYDEFARWVLIWKNGIESVVLAYFLSLNSIYLLMTIIASIGFAKYFRRAEISASDDVFANPLTPSVSIVVGARNEAVGIVETVHALLSLRYPEFELIVVDDGSTDETFEVLRASFDLVPTMRVPIEDAIATKGEVLSTFTSTTNESLMVVRKVNGGCRADAINAGLNFARNELVCMTDADSVFDPEALLRVARPFVDDPTRVVATGGVIRPSNGCEVDRGLLSDARMPREYLARIQVIEYLRSFMIGRTGWSMLNSILIISGAFGLYRRDLVIALRGLDPDSLAEDAELVARVHRYFRVGPGVCGDRSHSTRLPTIRTRRKYRIVFVTEPVCWTEVPVTRDVLGRQRRRWSRGLAEVLWKYRTMIFNPRYGRVGLVVMPYYLFFELLGPVVELLGVITVLLMLAVWIIGHLLNVLVADAYVHHAGLLAAAAVGYGLVLSLAALTVEEFSFHRMQRWRDLWTSIAASIGENIGYRQLHSWWRLQGLIQWCRGGKAEWGSMPRVGTRQKSEEVSHVRLEEA